MPAESAGTDPNVIWTSQPGEIQVGGRPGRRRGVVKELDWLPIVPFAAAEV